MEFRFVRHSMAMAMTIAIACASSAIRGKTPQPPPQIFSDITTPPDTGDLGNHSPRKPFSLHLPPPPKFIGSPNLSVPPPPEPFAAEVPNATVFGRDDSGEARSRPLSWRPAVFVPNFRGRPRRPFAPGVHVPSQPPAATGLDEIGSSPLQRRPPSPVLRGLKIGGIHGVSPGLRTRLPPRPFSDNTVPSDAYHNNEIESSPKLLRPPAVPHRSKIGAPPPPTQPLSGNPDVFATNRDEIGPSPVQRLPLNWRELKNVLPPPLQLFSGNRVSPADAFATNRDKIGPGPLQRPPPGLQRGLKTRPPRDRFPVAFDVDRRGNQSFGRVDQDSSLWEMPTYGDTESDSEPHGPPTCRPISGDSPPSNTNYHHYHHQHHPRMMQ